MSRFLSLFIKNNSIFSPKIWLLMAVFCPLISFAQKEVGGKFVPIAPSKNAKKPTPAPKKEDPLPFVIPPIISDRPIQIQQSLPNSKTEDKKNQLSMFEKYEFANPGDAFKDKFNGKYAEKEGIANTMEYRRNIDYGIIRTKSKTIRIFILDYGNEDGDLVDLKINSKLVYNQIYLTNSGRTITINLEEGFNVIEFTALNEGMYFPNTAGFTIYDDTNRLLATNQWNLSAGYKAKFVVLKEQ